MIHQAAGEALGRLGGAARVDGQEVDREGTGGQAEELEDLPLVGGQQCQGPPDAPAHHLVRRCPPVRGEADAEAGDVISRELDRHRKPAGGVEQALEPLLISPQQVDVPAARGHLLDQQGGRG